jgi:prevent-host-death family protein
MEVNIHHAKTNLSQLILKAESGEEVIIARAGKPVVRLIPIQPLALKKRKAGALKGILKISPDFFDPKLDEQIAEWFNESPLLHTDVDKEHGKHSGKKNSQKKKDRRK